MVAADALRQPKIVWIRPPQLPLETVVGQLETTHDELKQPLRSDDSAGMQGLAFKGGYKNEPFDPTVFVCGGGAQNKANCSTQLVQRPGCCPPISVVLWR